MPRPFHHKVIDSIHAMTGYKLLGWGGRKPQKPKPKNLKDKTKII